MKKRGKISSENVGNNAKNLNSILIENFVRLQKAITNLSIKFDSLSDNISKLLQLFEISARSFAEKLETGKSLDIEKDKEFLEKLDRLLDQNKVIAKGLTLMEEKIRERVYGTPQPTQAIPIPRQVIRQPIQQPRSQPFIPPISPTPAREGYFPSSGTERKTKEIEEME